MLLIASFALLSVAVSAAPVFESVPIERAYIVQLAPGKDASLGLTRRSQHHINNFHKRAAAIDYTVRHEYHDSDAFLGLSIKVSGNAADDEIVAQLQAIADVASVSAVYTAGIPIEPGQRQPLDPFLSFKNPPALKVAPGTGNLASTLQMGGVDKLHALGIKGKGIKIGIIDTGVDHRHPALGAGFGPGKKIAGGYSFVRDNGTLFNSPDPIATCYGGGHGTHVAGIVGMESVAGGFDIVGVAPEASLYMYRTFDCKSSGGSDTILAGMLKAQQDGVDIVSMSLSVGGQSYSGAIDPLAAVIKRLTDAGIAVIVANSNDAFASKYGSFLYSASWPAVEPTAIAVGSVANSNFPLVYSATDSAGNKFDYAAIYPLNFTDGADVFVLENGCDRSNWDSALASIENLNKTIIAFQTSRNCKLTEAGPWNGSPNQPVVILGFNADSTDPYEAEYNNPSPGFFVNVHVVNLNAAHGAIFANSYTSAGGYKKYKLFSNNAKFTSPPQNTGGLMDYYSSFGPVYHTYDLKPQLSAPGGHILATYPLGVRGGYAILSGTSMATPYIAGAYALVKSKYPSATWLQIRNLLQSNSAPLPWAYDKTILSATAQQGAGLVNVYDAIFKKGVVSPGQLTIGDTTHTVYGTSNVTIKNTAGKSKSYTLSHRGAGYMNYQHEYMEISQLAQYGSATFSQSTINIQAGASATIQLTIAPPTDVKHAKLPVFGGFIKVKDNTDGEEFSVPYIGAPYSIFNTKYILNTVAADNFPLPRVSASNADGTSSVAVNLLQIASSRAWSTVISTDHWSQEFRADLLPANTQITANNYGFNRTVAVTYIPSAVTPKTTIYGFASFGNLVNRTGFVSPGTYGPSGTGPSVTGPDGVKYSPGNGDYRILASVLRWGGTKGKKEDYDTWLGPVMRFV